MGRQMTYHYHLFDAKGFDQKEQSENDNRSELQEEEENGNRQRGLVHELCRLVANVLNIAVEKVDADAQAGAKLQGKQDQIKRQESACLKPLEVLPERKRRERQKKGRPRVSQVTTLEAGKGATASTTALGASPLSLPCLPTVPYKAEGIATKEDARRLEHCLGKRQEVEEHNKDIADAKPDDVDNGQVKDQAVQSYSDKDAEKEGKGVVSENRLLESGSDRNGEKEMKRV